MGHENCVFLLCIIREKHYNKQRMSSSIPDVKKTLYNYFFMGTHCNVHGLQIWAYKKYLKKKIKGVFFRPKRKKLKIS